MSYNNKNKVGGSPHYGSAETSLTSIHEDAVRSLALLSGSGICHCRELYGVGQRHGLDSELLWLWCRLAAVAPVRLLAWGPPYAAGGALKKGKKRKERKKDLCI